MSIGIAKVRAAAVASLILALSVELRAQETDSVDIIREATVGFDSGTVVLPPGYDSAALQEVTITVPAVESVLQANAAQAIVLAFPGLDPTDSIRISPSGDTVRLPGLSNVFVIRFPSGTDIDSVCTELESIPEVTLAEPDGIAEPCSPPNDPYFGSCQWNFRYDNQKGINWTPIWDQLSGALPSVKIGIIDFGIDWGHEDLGGRVSGDQGRGDPLYHGTCVAGVAAASTGNGLGIAGVDWTAALMSVRIDGKINARKYVQVKKAVDQGCQVTNSSWGLNGLPPL